ncbi:MAG: beta/gamma crystallin family protein [Alphaproteobacteria bacterium]|nr:beta/gamma crystallin family protein [Alphaproteobacteria bacterium]
MVRLICFAAASFANGSKEYLGNDPNLIITGDEYSLASAIAIGGSWTLYSEVGFTGESIVLSSSSGPESDGVFRDHADWGGSSHFHVKSIQRS